MTGGKILLLIVLAINPVASKMIGNYPIGLTITPSVPARAGAHISVYLSCAVRAFVIALPNDNDCSKLVAATFLSYAQMKTILLASVGPAIVATSPLAKHSIVMMQVTGVCIRLTH